MFKQRDMFYLGEGITLILKKINIANCADSPVLSDMLIEGNIGISAFCSELQLQFM